MSAPIAFEKNTVIVVFGASGDLAKKKTFPALFGLFREGYLDPSTKIFGYARSKLTHADLVANIGPFLKKPHPATDDPKADAFFNMITYVSGQYDTDDGYLELRNQITAFEDAQQMITPHRLFYLALPPSVFLPVAQQIKKNVYSDDALTRVIVEKPFGHDLQSARKLQNDLAPLFREDELFRIDHYLGKELVKNLIPLRFGNKFLNSSWNKNSIQNIQISFKEPFGTEGRGGYFDNIGIIRDVMQNHLLQILTLLTMDRPISFNAEDIRDEKVKVLKSIAPIDTSDVILGQYGKSEDGAKPAYLDDDTVQKDSKCVTFAALTFHINNERWDGVPIIMRAGKALNAGKVEIRVQYKNIPTGMFNHMPNNELVIRVQPDAAVYLKFNAKTPGLADSTSVTDLDLTYANRYKDFWIPEAYEVLIRDALLGDHSNFVRDDELDVSWKLFTPLLNYIEGPDCPAPTIYPYGSRGPTGMAEYLKKNNVDYDGTETYTWPVTSPNTK
ncbi:hypothetical protein DAKH74_017800 [Maudiozyma humilis]|uniref:Glucose-6-phosphate 1-dehydrogenase n=1 Tax=Maudiozyma humilis TaxID=51915 RepID=A0AAV5RUA4_MAUHU|nr:hypothetical protein DAKH74_017800 [Kazachstania humilis]